MAGLVEWERLIHLLDVDIEEDWKLFWCNRLVFRTPRLASAYSPGMTSQLLGWKSSIGDTVMSSCIFAQTHLTATFCQSRSICLLETIWSISTLTYVHESYFQSGLQKCYFGNHKMLTCITPRQTKSANMQDRVFPKWHRSRFMVS